MLIQPVSQRALLSIFRVAPTFDEEGAPIRTEEGKHANKLVPKFPFHWTYTHYERGINVYVWKKEHLGTEDATSFDCFTAFVAGIPPVQHMGRGENQSSTRIGLRCSTLD